MVKVFKELVIKVDKPGASGGGIFDTDGKLIGVHQNGVVGVRSGGILFSPAQLKWIQDHIKGISSSKPANLEETEKPVEEKPKKISRKKKNQQQLSQRHQRKLLRNGKL